MDKVQIKVGNSSPHNIYGEILAETDIYSEKKADDVLVIKADVIRIENSKVILQEKGKVYVVRADEINYVVRDLQLSPALNQITINGETYVDAVE